MKQSLILFGVYYLYKCFLERSPQIASDSYKNYVKSINFLAASPTDAKVEVVVVEMFRYFKSWLFIFTSNIICSSLISLKFVRGEKSDWFSFGSDLAREKWLRNKWFKERYENRYNFRIWLKLSFLQWPRIRYNT